MRCGSSKNGRHPPRTGADCRTGWRSSENTRWRGGAVGATGVVCIEPRLYSLSWKLRFVCLASIAIQRAPHHEGGVNLAMSMTSMGVLDVPGSSLYEANVAHRITGPGTRSPKLALQNSCLLSRKASNPPGVMIRGITWLMFFFAVSAMAADSIAAGDAETVPQVFGKPRLTQSHPRTLWDAGRHRPLSAAPQDES